MDRATVMTQTSRGVRSCNSVTGKPSMTAYATSGSIPIASIDQASLSTALRILQELMLWKKDRIYNDLQEVSPPNSENAPPEKIAAKKSRDVFSTKK